MELDPLKSKTFAYGVTKKTKRDIEKEEEERKRAEEEAWVPSIFSWLIAALLNEPSWSFLNPLREGAQDSLRLQIAEEVQWEGAHLSGLVKVCASQLLLLIPAPTNVPCTSEVAKSVAYDKVNI